MTTEGQLAWRKLFLILTVLSCCRSLEVSIPDSNYEVARGGDVTLTCSFVPAHNDLSTMLLTWEAYPDAPGEPMKAVASYFYNRPVNIAPAYEGRAFLEVDLDTRTSTLRLTKVTVEDSRSYQCSVNIYNDDEGTLAATTSLLVLVAPSTPICGIQGTAEYFQDIKLTCKSNEGSPAPTYSWKTYSTQNMARPFPPKTTEKDGVLSLFNVTRETSGFFVCTSENRIGSASCNLTLVVEPPSMGTASTVIIVVAVLAAVVVVGIIIFCCCCRKKGKQEEYAEGSPEEMEFHDKEEPEAGTLQYRDDKANSEKKQADRYEDKDVVPEISHNVAAAVRKLDDDQNSYISSKEKYDGRGSDIESQRYQDDQRDRYRGSRDRLDDQRDRYGGSRDRLDDRYDNYRGSRDRLDDQRDRYGGSRDRLDDQRDRNGGSRDRLDDQRDRYSGSRDRLDDQRDRYGGSRDRLDDHSDRYRSSRDNLNDHNNHYGGSRDRLDYDRRYD
ncbi:cell surface A33 antigen [Acanthochromis polyacanthus]|uniref:Glycoprotein A33 n=1 Tax=Acanthochromis polyacanthus TaxID=80966 RepID=A0A3Q1ERC5_9TELE|nr:cell surface A33 antigen [Acanthochromis polyacanthus]